jgi:P2 family phage contractile tail tube protein
MAKLKVNKLVQANVYVDGQNFMGRADEITLPALKETMIEHKGLGMHGKLKLPNGLEEMEAKFKWNSFYPEVHRAIGDPRRAVLLQVRGNLETHSGLGVENEVAVVAEIGGRIQETAFGSLKQGDPAMPEMTMVVTYYKLTVDGEELLEIDVLENIRKHNGVDILATMRRNIGA